MFDLYLSEETNDIVYEDGIFQAVSNYRELSRQRLYLRLNTWMEEWFINTEFGVPYRQSIIKKNVTKSEIDAIFISNINSEDLVDEITEYTSTIDTSARTYTASFTIKITNEDIENPLETTAADEWEYSATDSSLQNSSCAITYSNEVYYHINFELALDAVSTWQNTWS